MKYMLVVLAALLLLAACASRPPGEPRPSWERDDPARRVYGG
ncbi:MAG: hypothetical protein AB7R90_15495 [Reyranellaceae bacterium]